MKPSKVLIWVAVAALVAIIGYALGRPAGGVQQNIGDKELIDLVAQGARLVDVRSPGEYGMGHIEGAENVPDTQIAGAAQDWDREQPIVLYCATGARSADAMATLAGMGFKKLYNHTQGTSGWSGKLTTEVTSSGDTIETAGTPVMIEFTSDG